MVGAARARGAHGRLLVAGRDAEAWRGARHPAVRPRPQRAREQAEALRDAIEGAGLPWRIRLALKAQRDPAFLPFLRARAPFVGMDVCSPGELEWALEHGWRPEEISYTGTNLSDRDLARILPTRLST